MIFDFNVPYSKDVNDPYATKAVSFSQRAEKAAVNLVGLPGSILQIITEIAKLVFFAIGVALTFGQSGDMKYNFKVAFKSVIFMPALTAIEFIGVFAPLNAKNWARDVVRVYNQI